MAHKMLLVSTCTVLGLFAQIPYIYGISDVEIEFQHAKVNWETVLHYYTGSKKSKLKLRDAQKTFSVAKRKLKEADTRFQISCFPLPKMTEEELRDSCISYFNKWKFNVLFDSPAFDVNDRECLKEWIVAKHTYDWAVKQETMLTIGEEDTTGVQGPLYGQFGKSSRLGKIRQKNRYFVRQLAIKEEELFHTKIKPLQIKYELFQKEDSREPDPASALTTALQFQPASQCGDGWNHFYHNDYGSVTNPDSLFLVHGRDHFHLSLLSRDDTLPLELRGDKVPLLEMIEREAQNIRKKPLISTSLVSLQHPYTFFNRSGFVVSMKSSHILAMGPKDLEIAPQPTYGTPIDPKHAHQVICANPPCFSPAELMKQTEQGQHNEIVLRSLDEGGVRVEMRAVFLQKPYSHDSVHQKFNQTLREYAEKNKLRVIDHTIS